MYKKCKMEKKWQYKWKSIGSINKQKSDRSVWKDQQSKFSYGQSWNNVSDKMSHGIWDSSPRYNVNNQESIII